MNINRIIISGNLVANPTLRETNSGTPVASATIANNEFFNDGDGERQQVTTFVDVTVWGKSGESFASLAKKGQEVIIEGQLRRNDWESNDGQKHSKHFIKLKAGNSPNTASRNRAPRMLPPRTAKKARKPLPRKASNLFTGTGGVTSTPGTNSK